MLGGGRACEGRVVDNLRNARRVMGVRLVVLVEIMREAVESLPLLEVEVVAPLVDVDVREVGSLRGSGDSFEGAGIPGNEEAGI
jgi:hypothetical protein